MRIKSSMFTLLLVTFVYTGSIQAAEIPDPVLPVIQAAQDSPDAKLVNNVKQKAAEGDTSAENSLGLMYLRGDKGLMKDPDKAVIWFQESADAGNATGQFLLGMAYVLGEGVKENGDLAFKYFQQAALQNHPQAIFTLGLLYSIGIGTPKDNPKAIFWLTKADRFDNPRAGYLLGLMYRENISVPSDYVKAMFWFKRAASLGYPEAMTKLGDMYALGQGETKNPVQAMYWYQKGSDAGSPIADYHLGIAYALGWGGYPKNRDVALKWMQKSAAQNYQPAVEILQEYQKTQVLQPPLGLQVKDLGESFRQSK
jgi:TPR repeat protein